jgi:hypothetical protein
MTRAQLSAFDVNDVAYYFYHLELPNPDSDRPSADPYGLP